MVAITKSDLYWRLSDETGMGLDVVSMVLQLTQQQEEYELETDVISEMMLPSDAPLDLEWSEEDHQLFTLLIQKLLLPEDEPLGMPLDFADESIIAVVHMVAAARFAQPLDAGDMLAEDIHTLHHEYEVGDMVALNTINGFKAAIVVKLDSIDAHCVLLDPIEYDGMFIDEHEMLVVNKHSLLIPEFAEVLPGDQAVIH